MEFFLKVGIPILLVALFYVILKIVNRKEGTNKIFFVKIRLLLACIAVGALLTEAYSQDTVRASVPAILFIGIFGVVTLHNKYFSPKR